MIYIKNKVNEYEHKLNDSDVCVLIFECNYNIMLGCTYEYKTNMIS